MGRFEPYLTSRRRPEMILLRHETPICRKGKCQRKIAMENSNKWTLTIGLALLPTKATEQKIGGFGLNSKHEWSKTVEIPAWVEIKSIKVTLNEEKEKIVINGSKKNEAKDLNTDVIEVSDEEIDVELEELLDAAERKKEERNKDQEEVEMKS